MISSNQMLAGSGLDEIYAQINSSGTTGYLRDGLNSTVAVTNSSAASTANYSYSPYGDSAGTGTSATPLQYTGRENDGATGLYYYRARYYLPQMGRFISEDPIGLGGGSNFYAYVGGDPARMVDPLGLCANQPTGSQCLWVAAKAKGASIGLDIIGAIPVVGNATSAATAIVRAGISLNHLVTSPAVSLVSGAYGEYQAIAAGPEEATDALVGAGSASAGIALVLADMSLEGGTPLPGIGNIISIGTGVWDIYKAYEIYQQCMAGH
jgi:RHS repeat-associated protein